MQAVLGGLGETLQRMSLEETEVTGLLLGGMNVHRVSMSWAPTQSCCQVEWAATEEKKARKATADFMFAVGVMVGDSYRSEGCIGGLLYEHFGYRRS